MTIWAWIGLSGIIVFSLFRFLDKKQRTKTNIRETIVLIAIVIGIIIAVLFFDVPYLFAFILGVIVYILLDKKTYTKKRLFIYGGIILILVVLTTYLFRDNPDYVLNHLKNNPETTSLYVVSNGDEVITYQSDTIRPLASTVKIPIAIEYAIQVDEGLLDKEQLVSLDDLNRFHLENTDGGAHKKWLDSVQEANKVRNNSVSLHEVAKGMITYSSNANTDYLLHLLGIDSVNERIQSLGLTQHEPVYPLASSLLLPDYISTDSMSEDEIINELRALPMEQYRESAIHLSDQMKTGELDISSYSFDSSLAVQRVWSDRLTRASATSYGKLLSIISNDELPSGAAEIVRDLMEWPMEINKKNKDFYTHVGSKGGSTAFILNDALYVEDLDGDKTEIVLFTDQLNLWQSFMIGNNINSFEVRLIGDEEYRQKVKEELVGIE